jgi:hypothetical protein
MSATERTLLAVLDRLGTLGASLWDQLDSPYLLCAASTCSAIKDSIDAFLRTASNHASSRLKLAAVLGAHRHGGYLAPFTVEDSPSLLDINYQTTIWNRGHFRCAFRCPDAEQHPAGTCCWDLFEDTFRMRFNRVQFDAVGDAQASTPSEVAAKFRRFLCPVRDGPGELLHTSTLSLVGRLLPDGRYVARWHQLPLMTTEDEKIHQRDFDSILKFSASEVCEAWNDPTAGAPNGHEMFLRLPRGALPDLATREAMAACALDGQLAEDWALRDADFTSICRARLVLCSCHWPRMHPLLPTQPPEALDEATVAAYVASLRLRDAADDSARPTALLFEMKADVHLQSAYMILDGHHKIEALRRLSCDRRMAGEAAPRINFLVISPRMPTASSIGNRGLYMDEDTGVQEAEQARGDGAVPMFSMREAQAAAKHAAALRALHDASQVVCVLADLLHEVQARAEREARGAFVARKREEARMRAQVETLKEALQAANVPGLGLGSHLREVNSEGLEAQLRYWEGMCSEHGVGLPGPEGKRTATDEEVDLGDLFEQVQVFDY